MSERAVDHLLIGGGLAAASCAETLREEGAEGSILMVGREPDPPYSRPPLSKKYLKGESSRDDALRRPAGEWAERDVELLTRTSVMKLDADGRRAKLSNGDDVAFETALLATGANVRRLRADGADLEGIHYLRSFGNADAIARDVAEAERVVLVGGSYIGCECAATLTAMGKRCAILMQEDVTLERVYGREAGGFFQRVLEEHGVEVHGGDSLARFEGSDGRVERVVTEAGLILEAGCVVVGAGVMPDVMLARGAGLEIGETGGVACSDRLETSTSGIYAAGDMCEYESALFGRLRVEHWDVAQTHGKTAALNMLGRDEPYETLPYFFSDLDEWASSEYVGHGSGEAVIRGSLEDGDFTAFYLEPESGRVTAALTVGRPDDVEDARGLIRGRAAPPRERLADAATDLGSLGS